MEDKRKIESEIDFISVLKNPIRMFGLVFIYFFVIALAIGIYYVHNLDSITFNVVPGTALDTLNIEREIDRKVGGIKPAMDLRMITNPTPEFIKKGKDLYKLNCASCHGDNGLGDGLASTALNPKPRNFTLSEGWTNGRTFFDMYKSVNDGVPGTGMTAYEFLLPENRVPIIQFIRTLGEYPGVTEKEVNEKIEPTYKLSAGVVEPNNIPIQRSIKIFSEETRKETELYDNIVNSIIDDQAESAVLLKKNSNDLTKVVSSFIRSNLKDYKTFISTVSLDPYSFGFKTSALLLNDSDLSSIYKYLSNIC